MKQLKKRRNSFWKKSFKNKHCV